MTDNQLIQIFLPIIQAGLIADNFMNVAVLQSNQPRTQSVLNMPSVYFTKIMDKRYGFLRREEIWDSTNSIMKHVETQVYESTYQVEALVLQNPVTPNQYTASDLVNEISSILQSSSTIEQLMSHNIGILRIQDIRNPYFLDDKDQFEASPSFDFVLTYQQVRTTTSPIISSFTLDIERV